MQPQQIAVLVVAAVICAMFTWGVIAHFSRPHGVPRLMYVIGIATGALTAAQLARLAQIDPGWWAVPALLGYLAAAGVYLWAVAATRGHGFSLAFSQDLPKTLVARGPYRFVRHPFYASYLLYWIAGALAIRELWVLPAIGLVAILYVLAAVTEERKFARSSVSDAYNAYRRSTGMFLPRFSGPPDPGKS
jgi:protein-S-isoprenylcysteine O-methyltransferase Ste14